MSVRGSLSVQGEETNREAELSGEVGADRITDAWKITIGAQFEYSREDFDLDENEPLRASRDEREFEWLVVKSLNDHWSVGALGQIESSSFDNFDAQIYGAPAVEFNFFPYSAYTRRQLRTSYSIGPYKAWYGEETLLGKLEDTMGRHEASVTLDQREPWGSLAGPLRGVELSSRDRPASPRRRRRGVAAPRPRALLHGRRFCKPPARPDLAAAARRDR